MVWLTNTKARADDAVEELHRQHGEQVFVRRLVPTSPDQTYQEDQTRTEQEYKLLAVVQNNPSLRTLMRYGRAEPIDLLLTFCHNQLTNVGLPSGPVAGDIVAYRGKRHTVVQVQEVKTPIQFEDDIEAIDQISDFLELAVLAVISTNVNQNITTFEQPPQATVVSATIAGGTKSLEVTLSASCVAVGSPMKRLRVSVDGVVVGQASVAVVGTALTITLKNAVTLGQQVRLTYSPQAVRPVTDGLVRVDNAEELQGVSNAIVTVT